MATKKKKKAFYNRLQSKYRLVIMNDDNFEEKASWRLSPMNVFVSAGTIIIILITLTTLLIAFTPLREYIPGYADVGMQRNLIKLKVKADSLEQTEMAKDVYIKNIKNIVSGNIGNGADKKQTAVVRYDTIRQLHKSKADSMLRNEIESEDRFALNSMEAHSFSGGISSFFFFTPLKGTISNRFNSSAGHFGIDIVAPQNEAIKSTLDGTVVISGWSAETGYVIGIQHANNILSLYKHNSTLLKKVGDYVKAGEVIAIIGDTGELSSGPHLHFELWYNGNPLNPKDYLVF